MLALIRSLRLGAALAALVLLAPALSAACLHGPDHGMAMEDATSHERPAHGPADPMPPCHEAPAPDEPGTPPDGCVSVCCTTHAATETLAPLPVPETAGHVAVTVVRAVPASVPMRAPTASPSPPPGRLHVALQRFLI